MKFFERGEEVLAVHDSSSQRRGEVSRDARQLTLSLSSQNFPASFPEELAHLDNTQRATSEMGMAKVVEDRRASGA